MDHVESRKFDFMYVVVCFDCEVLLDLFVILHSEEKKKRCFCKFAFNNTCGIFCLKSIWIFFQIQIKGPVSCRRGVLMLSQNNVQLLGGEVEELFPANNREAVLCSCLGRPVGFATNARLYQFHRTFWLCNNGTLEFV